MKKPVKSKNVPAPKKNEPDIANFMVKIQDQLAALANKMDSWIAQIPTASSHGHAHPAPVVPQAVSPQKPFQPAIPSQPVQRPPLSQGPREARPGRGRRDRILHKAVCADCHKDCEIPFKPSGERPVYCKPCFSKRKAGDPVKVESVSSPAAAVVASEPAKVDRRVVVTKKGVGKVTVSEIVRSPVVVRAFPSRDKSQKPAQRAKK